MAEEPFALSTIPPPPPVEGDYDAICATVRQSARGRWFLDEYARRNRNADTRLVLAAIERLETVVQGSRDREAYQSMRGDLLEMARTIAVTRAEVAESKAEPRAEDEPAAERQPPAGSDVFAMAERIQDVAWTMRERGLDPRTCDQIETLARTILTASSLRTANDDRTRKLAEVLQYLERRIDRMIEAHAQQAEGFAPQAESVESAAAEPPAAEPRAPPAPEATKLVMEGPAAAQVEPEPVAEIVEQTPAAPQSVAVSALEPIEEPTPAEVEPAVVENVAESTAASEPAPVEIPPAEVLATEVLATEVLATEVLATEVLADEVLADEVTADVPDPDAPRCEATPQPSEQEPALAESQPADFLLEPLPPPVTAWPASVEWAPAPMAATEPVATDQVAAQAVAPESSAQKSNAQASIAVEPPSPVIGQVHAIVRPMARSSSSELLAALAAMSDHERIALFS
jgi:hypothetical protein